MKTTKEIVYEFIQQEIYSKNNQEGVETKIISEALNMQRSNVSALLNELVKEEKLIKTNTRPVLYKIPDKSCDNTNEDCWNELIGCNGSLRNAIQLAKAAILYPRKTLNVLLSSKSGCGTTSFAYMMFRFAKEHHILKENAVYVKINCSHYSKNVSALNDDLFGENGKLENSYFARAKGGMLFIDYFDLLNAKQQSRIFVFLETGKIYSEDNTEFIDCSDVALVLACSPQNMSQLNRRIPVVIELPELKERPLEEKFDLINHFFSIEAFNSDRSIEASIDAIKALLLSDYTYNVKELEIEIKSACANAYVRVVSDGNQSINVYLNDFNRQIKRNLLKLKDNAQEIDKLLGMEKYILYDKSKGYLNRNSENLYNKIKTQYDELYNRGINPVSIESVINNHIKTLFNQYSYSYSTYEDDSRNLEQLSKIVDKKIISIVSIFLDACKKEFNRDYKPSVFYGLCLHVNALISSNSTHQHVSNEQIVSTIQNFPKEYASSVQFAGKLKEQFDINLDTEEMVLITMFLIETEDSKEEEHPVLLYIMHGNGTAKSLMEVTNTLTHSQNAYSYDMDLGMETSKAMEEIRSLILKIDHGKGVIVIYDMGSIKTMIDTISEECNVKIRCMNIPITLIGIDIARKCTMESDIDYVFHMANREISHFNSNNEKHNEAIITLCHTGEGGATQLKSYIDQYSKLNMKVFALSISDRNALLKEVMELKKTYEIHAFVGTYDPKLLGIPFISIASVFENSKENLDRILMFEPTSATSFNYHEMYQHLEEQCRFVSIAKLKMVMPPLIDELSIIYGLSEDQRLGLFMHLSCLIERLLSGENSRHNQDTDRILNAYNEDYRILSKMLKILEKAFKVIIDDNEIATIIMILRKI